MVKLIWAPTMGDAAGETAMEEMRSAVERAGKARIILARCDTAAAIRFGQSVGITMFQGRHLDAVLQNESRKKQVAQRLRPRRCLRMGTSEEADSAEGTGQPRFFHAILRVLSGCSNHNSAAR